VRTPDNLTCPHWGENGCKAYDQRPLVCRMFGTVPKLACPKGRGLLIMLSQKLEEEMLHFTHTEKHELL
jgi:Fe-S-cluster containining protein